MEDTPAPSSPLHLFNLTLYSDGSSETPNEFPSGTITVRSNRLLKVGQGFLSGGCGGGSAYEPQTGPQLPSSLPLARMRTNYQRPSWICDFLNFFARSVNKFALEFGACPLTPVGTVLAL